MSTGGPSDGRERRLRRLLEAVIDLEPEAQAARLAQSNEEPNLVEEVRELLASEAELGGFLQQSAVAALSEEELAWVESGEHEPGDVVTGSEIGSFTLVEELGEGGMGRVYLAQQSAPIERRVAFKVMRGGLLGEAGERRFLRERQALARLSHPNIARFYEAGATAKGRPWVAMELVEGPPITEYCDRGKLSIDQRLRLFAAICRGVNHAHQKQLLHRDLKPSNILVAEVDGEPVPKVIDFGIAEHLGAEADSSDGALSGELLGTPAYLSPEAALGRSADVDTRSDVYSLGILLYELLIGHKPWDESEVDAARTEREEPWSLSECWSRRTLDERHDLAVLRSLKSSALTRRLRGDLDAIARRAIATDRDRRYGSAAELAADIGRHLHHEPVEAHPPSLTYVFGRFGRRHRGLAAAGALLALTLVGGVVARTLEAQRANVAAAEAISARDQAVVAREEAEEITRFLTGLFQSSGPLRFGNLDPRDVRELTALELLDRGAANLTGDLSNQPRVQARMLLTLGEVYKELALYERAEALLQDSLELHSAYLRPDHPDLAKNYRALAHVKLSLHHLEETEAHLTRAREILEQHRDDRPRQFASVLEDIGRLRHEQGEFEAAEALFLESMQLRQAHFGEDDSELALSHNNLGNLYRILERFEEAEQQYAQSLEIFRRALPENHPRVVTAVGNLAIALASQDRLAEAAPLFEQVLEARREVLGEDHPSVAQSWNNLGVLYVDLDRPADAVPAHRRALAIRESALGEEHPLVAWSLRNLAVALRRSEAEEPTEPLLLRAVAIWEEALGPAHPHLAEGYNSLANLYSTQGRGTLARNFYQRAMAIWQPVLGADSPKVVRTRERLAALESNPNLAREIQP